MKKLRTRYDTFKNRTKHFYSLYLRVKLPLPPVRPCGKNGRPITFKAYRHLDELAGKQGPTNLGKIVNYTCGVRLEWGVCGRAFNSSNSFSEGPGFKPRQSRNFPRQLRNFSLLCLSSPRCMNGYRQHTAGGEPCDGLASRPGGSSNTPRLASCYGNRYKLRPCGSLARVRLYILPITAPLDVSLCASLSFSILFTITQKENSMLWVN